MRVKKSVRGHKVPVQETSATAGPDSRVRTLKEDRTDRRALGRGRGCPGSDRGTGSASAAEGE